MEYYSAMKKEKTTETGSKWIHFTEVTPSESQTQKILSKFTYVKI